MQTADVDRIREQIGQLVRAGDTRQLKLLRDQLKSGVDRRSLATRTSKYGAHPVRWVEERLGQTVWSKQREILNAVRDHRRVAVRSGHGVGKSWTAALVACWWLDTHPPGEAFVVSTAPTFSQVRAILWRYIRKHHRSGHLVGRVNQTEWLIDEELVGYGRKPADTDTDGFQGIHARYVLVLIDEACGVPEQLWTAADALATGPDCRILAIGNPDNPASHFRKVCMPGSSWHQLAISAFDSPNLTGEPVPEEMATALVSRDWAEEKAKEWGEENPVYRSKVLGEFSEDSTHQVVRGSDVARCRLAWDTRPPADRFLPVELGVDVGGGGDETVIRERRGIQAGREWRAHTDRPELIAPLVLRAMRESGAVTVKVDSIGVGFGVIGELRNAGRRGEHVARIVGVNVGEAASQPDKFLNLRAELWWEVGRGLSESGSWHLAGMDNADTTVAQLLEPRWDVDPRGRIRVEPKDEIRKRLGRSPDNADALLLAFYRPPRVPRKRVAVRSVSPR